MYFSASKAGGLASSHRALVNLLVESIAWVMAWKRFLFASVYLVIAEEIFVGQRTAGGHSSVHRPLVNLLVKFIAGVMAFE